MTKLRTIHVEQWRDELDMADTSKNRTLTTLKAVLDFAVKRKRVEPWRASEWSGVDQLDAEVRRTLYLDAQQRR